MTYKRTDNNPQEYSQEEKIHVSLIFTLSDESFMVIFNFFSTFLLIAMKVQIKISQFTYKDI